MITDVLQPSLKRQMKHFGGRNLVLSIPSQYPTILQGPEMVEGPTAGSPGAMYFGFYTGGVSSNAPALVDIARDWVGLVLKPRAQPSQPASVFDMAALDLGRVLREPSEEDDLFEEMLDDTRF